MPVLVQCPVFVLFWDYRRTKPRSELNFKDFPVDNKDLKIIARCNGAVLRDLALPGCSGISPLGISALCNGATALTRLDLTHIPSMSDKALRSIARHLKKLEDLRLSHTKKVSDKGVIAVVEHCLMLRELYLGDMPFVTDKTLVALTDKSGEGKYSRPLEVLTLRNLPKLTDKGMTTLLGSPAVRKLREFRLAGTRAVSNMGLIGMANISATVTHLETKRRLAGTAKSPSEKGFQHLTRVDLPGLQLLTDRGVSFVAENCPMLQELNLKRCTKVTDEGLAFVGERCAHMRVLNLEGCDCITDKGIKSLVHRKPSKLRDLNVSGVFHVGDVAVGTVARRCPDLRRICLDGLVDVTDVSVEELLRCCVYLQHISLAERYIMPSDAHAQRFDAVTRDRAARKVRKKAKSKDLQFSKKQRKILAVVDKMMAEEEQAKEGTKIRDNHYHSTQAVIRAFNGSPRVTDAVLIKVVQLLGARNERNLFATLVEAQHTKIPPWFTAKGTSIDARLRIALTGPTPGGGDDQAAGLDWVWDDGDAEEDVAVLVQEVVGNADVPRPVAADVVSTNGSEGSAASMDFQTFMALEPSSPRGGSSSSEEGSHAGSPPQAPPKPLTLEEFHSRLSSSVPCSLGGPDFEALPPYPPLAQHPTQALTQAVGALQRQEAAEADARAAADATMRAQLRSEMLGESRRSRRRRGKDKSCFAISQILEQANRSTDDDRKDALATPLATQLGGTSLASGTGSAPFGRSLSSGGSISMRATLQQSSLATLPPLGATAFTGTGMHLGLGTTFGTTRGRESMLGGTRSSLGSTSRDNVPAPDTGCLWMPDFPLPVHPDDDAQPFRSFSFLNLSGNPRLRKLWSSLAVHPGQLASVAAPPLVAVVRPGSAAPPATPAPATATATATAMATVPRHGRDANRVAGASMGASAANKGSTGALHKSLLPPKPPLSSVKSAEPGSPGLRKSVRFSPTVASKAFDGDVAVTPTLRPGASFTFAPEHEAASSARHVDAAPAPPPLPLPDLALTSGDADEDSEFGTGDGAPRAESQDGGDGGDDGGSDMAPSVDGLVVPPMCAYDRLGDVRFMGLRTLRLRGCVRLEDEAMDSLALCPVLTSLDLSGCYKISDQGLVRLSMALDRAANSTRAMWGVMEAQKAERRRIRRELEEAADPRLYRRRLRIMQTKGITQEQLDAPNEPPVAEHPLGHLDLSQLPLITDSGVTVLLATTPKLHNLNIAKTRCSDVTIQVLANMCTGLRTLDVSNCKGDDTFGFVAGAVGKRAFGLEPTQTGTFRFGTHALQVITEHGAQVWRSAEELAEMAHGPQFRHNASGAGGGEASQADGGEGGTDAAGVVGHEEFDEAKAFLNAKGMATKPSFRDFGMESVASSDDESSVRPPRLASVPDVAHDDALSISTASTARGGGGVHDASTVMPTHHATSDDRPSQWLGPAPATARSGFTATSGVGSVTSWLSDVSAGQFDDAASEVSDLFVDRVAVARVAEEVNTLRIPAVRKRVENVGVTPHAVEALGKHLELGELADPFTQYFGLRPVQKWKLRIARTRRHHATNAKKIQDAIRGYLNRTHTLERKMGQAMRSVGGRIAAKHKIWKNWKIFKHRRAVLKFQGQAQMALMQRLAHHKASKQIQRIVRGYLAKRRVHRLRREKAKAEADWNMKLFQTSVMIQRIIRGRLSRLHVRRMRRDFTSAVMLMQKLLRGVRARRRIRRFKEQAVPASQRIQHWWRQKLLLWAAQSELGARRHQAFVVQMSAIDIQRAARGFVARSVVKRRRRNFNFAATRIQARVRGNLQRAAYAPFRCKRLHAVTKIQSVSRMHLTKAIVERRRFEVAQQQQFLNDSARLIQKNWRNRRLRVAILAIQVVRTMSAAARNIQRVYRGHLGRRRFKFYWRMRRARFLANQRQALHGSQQLRALRWGAAQRIQLRIFRHHLWRRRTRDRVAARYNAMATRIQSVWRMHVMRKYFAMLFKEMTAGAITVQRVFRGMLGRRRYADALVQRLRGQCSTVICSLVRMFLCKVHVQRRREQFNAAARVIQRGYQQSCARARWSIAYVDLLATEFERLVKAGYSRKTWPLKLDKIRPPGSLAMKNRMDILYYSIEKEAMKLFEGSVKTAEAKLRSVEKKVKVELGQMRAAAHRSDAVFQQKLQQKRMLDALAEACYEKNLELLAMKETKARAIDLTRRYEDDIEFFCEALDEELAANDNIMEEEQLERVLALLTTEEV